MIYNISQLKIAMHAPHVIQQQESFQPFLVDAYEGKDFNYLAEFMPVNEISQPTQKPVSVCTDYMVTFEDCGYCRYFFHSRFENLIYAKSRWDWEQKKIIVEYIPRYQEFLSQSGNAIFHIGLEQIFLREQRLILHAACVDTDFGGILFTGPSGAGKSTQADLWVKHRNAHLINGDRPILSEDECGWRAWGSPYAGSSKCYVNKNCQVKAIVRIVQASENKIVRLSGGKAFSTVFSGITVNDWSREDVDLASGLVIKLIKTVPVYAFHCTKTEEAVVALEQNLKGETCL